MKLQMDSWDGSCSALVGQFANWMNSIQTLDESSENFQQLGR